jgi:hypothetical protein
MRRAIFVPLLPLVIAACGGESRAVTPSTASDDLVANFNRHGITDLTKTTHIILVGDSDELANLPLFSATTRARRYAELYPDDQIILFVTRDVSESSVARTGATVIHREGLGATMIADLSTLTADRLVAAIDRFTRIASIDFYGHSSPFGVLLESSGGDRTLGAAIPAAIGDLADNFAIDRNPYVTLNGCNGGVHTAPALSGLWAVPVAGALSATRFEVLMSDGRWYADDPQLHPASVAAVSRNDRSFSAANAPSCASGACVRMKPENGPYVGVWSAPEGFQYGLNYFKFFCKFDDSADACSRGMASSLLAFPSIKPIDATSSDEDIQDVLADFFCTATSDPTWVDTCRARLFAAAADGAAFSPMRSANDYSLECDFGGCEQQFRCAEVEGVPQQHSCAWVSSGCTEDQSNAQCKTKNAVKQTTNQELTRYLAGFALLRGN